MHMALVGSVWHMFGIGLVSLLADLLGFSSFTVYKYTYLVLF